jgi:hypothetical protein
VSVFPNSQRNVFIGNNGAALWNFNNSLATPYVMEWSFGVQRELFNRVTFEARYVGNHAVKQYRAWSINELNFYNTGLLNEFRNAQRNLEIGRTSFANQGLSGQSPLPIFERLFAGLPAGSGFSNSAFLTNLRENRIGTMFDTIRRLNTYRVNREANLPLNYFVANPFAADAIHVDNSSWSYWHGLEVEVNRAVIQRDLLPQSRRQGTVSHRPAEAQVCLQHGGGLGHGPHDVGRHPQFLLDGLQKFFRFSRGLGRIHRLYSRHGSPSSD